MLTPERKPSLPRKPEDKKYIHVNPPDTILATLSFDIMETVLTALRNAAQWAPVPCLQEAAGLALVILNTVQGVKYNKESFKRLAYDACGHVYTVLCLWGEQDENGMELSPGLRNHLRDLIDGLIHVHRFAQYQTTRSWIMQFVAQKSDVQKIQEYRERLKQALDVFSLQSNITICETVIRMSERQETLFKELRSRDARTHADLDLIPLISPTSPPSFPRRPTIPVINPLRRPLAKLVHNETIYPAIENFPRMAQAYTV